MSSDASPPLPSRLPTGIPGLDEVLAGGLFRGGVYIVMGVPGVGKTILANQLAFAHARAGGRVVYATLLSETHGRLLAFMGAMAFYDPALVGGAITYLNGYGQLEEGGLAGLLKLIREVVRDRRATLLVLDGMLPATTLAQSELEYKKFVQQLQTWIEVMGCTVIILSSAREAELRPEYTMVDGIIEAEYVRAGRRRLRELTVRKLRGSGYLEGAHTYRIADDGITVYPRVESAFGRRAREAPDGEPAVTFGRPGLDALFGGGVARFSSTLALGPNGSGKTTLGMHFLAAGLDAGEPVLHFSLYEDPTAVVDAAERLGLRFAGRLGPGELDVRWVPSGEILLDRLGHEILESVAATRARRLFVDGLEAFQRSSHPERLPAFLAALVQELRTRGVTTLLTSEASRLLVGEFETPFPGLSAVVDNIVLLSVQEIEGRLVRAAVVPKTRAHSHGPRRVEFDIGPAGIVIPSGARAGAGADTRRRRGTSSSRGTGRRRR